MKRQSKFKQNIWVTCAWATAITLKAQGTLSERKWTHFNVELDNRFRRFLDFQDRAGFQPEKFAARVSVRKDGIWLVIAPVEGEQVQTNKTHSINWSKLSKDKSNLSNIHYKQAA